MKRGPRQLGGVAALAAMLALIASAWPKRQRATCRTVDNCIAKLRQKIESNPECPVLIRTVRGIGYKFVPLERVELVQEKIANEGIS